MDLTVITIVLLLLLSLHMLTRHFRKEQEKRDAPPALFETYNTTNYNMEVLDESKFRKLTPKQARELVENWKESGYIPSHREFYAIKRILRREAKESLQQHLD